MKSLRHKLCSILLAFGFLPLGALAAGSSVPVTPIDDIVAIVNNDVITQHELDERYARAVEQLQQRKIQLPPHDVLVHQLLDRMINDKVQLQDAEQTGIRVDAPTLDRAIAKIAEQNNMSLDQFRAMLTQQGIPFDKFSTDIRNEIILSRLRQRDVDSKISVSESEVDNYLATRAKLGADEEYHLAHIGISIPDNATPQQIAAANEKAQMALQKLQQGADFAQVSAAYSDSQNALEGGDLGWRSPAQIPPDYLDIISHLQPGETSGLLRDNNAIHIIRLLEKRDDSKPAIIQQTHARHILIKTNAIVSDDDAKKRLDQIRQDILSGKAKFSDMAKKYSDDGSASKGGDLGWLSPGDTVPEFEHAMDALKPGDISEPVKSPFGYHLIQVLERRSKDVTLEKRRLMARQAIHDRKLERATEDWVRELRDRAYVKILNNNDQTAGTHGG